MKELFNFHDTRLSPIFAVEPKFSMNNKNIHYFINNKDLCIIILKDKKSRQGHIR